MKRLGALFVALTLSLAGCEMDVDSTQRKPDIDVDVKGTPDLNPATDHDVDVKVDTGAGNRGVDVKVNK